MATDLTIVLVNFNTRHLLAECFTCLQRAIQDIASQVIVVDNASSDDSLAFMRRHCPGWEIIANPENIGFGRANNQALARMTGRYLLLLNTDAFVAPDSLVKTLAYMEKHPRCGILGVRLIGRDGTLQPSARFFPHPGKLFLQRTGLARFFPGVRLMDDLAWDHATVRPCDWVPGCFYLVRREVIADVGLFDPRYFLYYEEVDHCFAAKQAGWEVTFYPDTAVVHLGGESARTTGEITPAGRQVEALQLESELLYFRKNHGPGTLAAHLFLTLLGDAYLALKRLVRWHRPLALAAYLKHAGQVSALVVRTGWGARPTR